MRRPVFAAHDLRNFLEVAPAGAALPGDFLEVAGSEAGRPGDFPEVVRVLTVMRDLH